VARGREHQRRASGGQANDGFHDVVSLGAPA
jgi:hypothetical protein